ncbi:hypothetical protein, partial [Escherichia coli]|uniref:hypothetical protein n=1 Tax=Escherichia coli TaxID=562 RepID=UPI001BC8362A
GRIICAVIIIYNVTVSSSSLFEHNKQSVIVVSLGSPLLWVFFISSVHRKARTPSGKVVLGHH